ncbi:MAG: alternative ribosome rescue aminoacyl-tRNA hydrolase ArfB [Pseudomonadota bacterium]
MLAITDTIALEDWELTETFSRASGPGGQNVNKVNTAVHLRFEAARSPNLPGDVKARLKRLAGHRWTADGAVIIASQKHRSQAMNREDALEKLRDLILKALERPKPRLKTRPTLASKRRRLEAKTKRSQVKNLRGAVREER